MKKNISIQLLISSAIILFVLILFIVLKVVADKIGIVPYYFTADPTMPLERPFYIGMVSHVYTILWSMTCGLCLAGAILGKTISKGNNSRFLWDGFFLSLILCLDDALLLHDEIF